MVVQEQYKSAPIGVNTSVKIADDQIAGFACVTSGTLTVVKFDGTAVLTSFPVTAGIYHPLPFRLGGEGGTVTTAGGASGTIAY